jgi:hypothetical protein
MSRTYKYPFKPDIDCFGRITYPWKSYARFSVPSWFKRMNRREERAKQNQALRENKEIPVVKKRDAYEFW